MKTADALTFRCEDDIFEFVEIQAREDGLVITAQKYTDVTKPAEQIEIRLEDSAAVHLGNYIRDHSPDA